MKDHRAAQRVFDSKYWNKGVRWQGWVVKIGVNDDDPLSLAYHSASILVKMDEDDHAGISGADLGLSFSERSLAEMSEVLDDLHRGDRIEFEASL